ncbi:hypothetical protein Tco_1243691 [Tanacetum coccineum]
MDVLKFFHGVDHRELDFLPSQSILFVLNTSVIIAKDRGFKFRGVAAEEWFQVGMTRNGLSLLGPGPVTPTKNEEAIESGDTSILNSSVVRAAKVFALALFEESVRNCFGPSEYEDPNGVLSKLLQLRTVKDYQWEFEKLMNRAMDIPDSVLISYYISGLKLQLQRELLVSRPTTLGPVTPTENEEAIESGDTSILNSLFGHESPRSFQLLGTLGTVTLEIQGRIYLFSEPLNAKYIKKKKMKAEFQRRIWKPGIKIVFKTPP